MYTVIRYYTGAPGFADEIQKHKDDVEKIITSVPGFVAYYLIKSPEGATSVTVCDDRAGCAESSRRAADFIRTKMSDIKVSPPQLIEGELALKFTNYATRV